MEALTPSYQAALNSLKDIHESTPVMPFDYVFFWLVLGGIVLALLTVGILGFWYWNRRYRDLFKLKKIVDLFCRTKDVQFAAYSVNRLLKALVIKRIDSNACSLSGSQWLNFLNNQVSKPIFDQAQADLFYDPKLQICNDQNFHHMLVFLKKTRIWLKKYRLKKND